MEEIVKQQIERLDKEISGVSKELNDFLNNVNIQDYSTFHEWEQAQSKWTTKLDVLRRKRNLLLEPKYEDIPEYGDVMDLEDFIECCEDGGFIDYDGSGNYATEDKMTDITIYPSDITSGNYRKDFPKIVWFNK
jgi:hypothetical protein